MKKKEILAIIDTRIAELKQGDIWYCKRCGAVYDCRRYCQKCHIRVERKPTMFRLRERINRIEELEKLKLLIEGMN